VFRRHLGLIVELKSGAKLIHEMRKAAAWYARGMYGANNLRQKIWNISAPQSVLFAVEEHFAALAERERRAA
jgi:tRNA-dihydrouridine synthase